MCARRSALRRGWPVPGRAGGGRWPNWRQAGSEGIPLGRAACLVAGALLPTAGTADNAAPAGRPAGRSLLSVRRVAGGHPPPAAVPGDGKTAGQLPEICLSLLKFGCVD
jgi:hypothetical protein